ncbi:hypothetical protein [Leifsonia sp. 22587]|uniref:hypothetical protein n=1 Tax=Leifsonia sp. 22587 TaxID=3453946 RepID=UPI003F836605
MNKHERAKAERLSLINWQEGALDGDFSRAVDELEAAAHALDFGEGDDKLLRLRDALRRFDLLNRAVELLGDTAEFERELEARA